MQGYYAVQAIFLLGFSIIVTIIFLAPNKRRKNNLKGIFNLWDVIRYGLIRHLGKPNFEVMKTFEGTFGPVFMQNYSSHETLCVMDIGLAKKLMSRSVFANRLPGNHIFYHRSNKKAWGPLFGDFKRNERVSTQRFEHDDPHGHELHQYFHHWQQKFNFGSSIVSIFNWLRHIPKLTEHDSWIEGHQKLFEIFQTIIKEKQVTKAYMDKPQDCIDYFLQKMSLQDSNNIDDSKGNVLTEEIILVTCADLFIAGSVNISYELEFAILFMALYPSVQGKVQDEIDSIIGSNNSVPLLNSKNLMVYTEATTLEILRYSSIIGMLARSSVEDARINEIPVSKDTTIAINIFGIHFSSRIWEDPAEFKPERFLNAGGTAIVNQDKIIPFGYGKRRCFGESAARSTFFLFYTSLLQKFTFSISPNHGPPSLENLVGIAKSPKPYFVTVKERLNGIS
ncbi:unnamed protein product [Allacma fusca]|uniref:Cytochrome P450 n=1 Tax=Allacma fusca TaxID=39272 RepID=A0A8J2L7B3_9HEXA|nr:unnamed protein product [Allacma fusca]